MRPSSPLQINSLITSHSTLPPPAPHTSHTSLFPRSHAPTLPPLHVSPFLHSRTHALTIHPSLTSPSLKPSHPHALTSSHPTLAYTSLSHFPTSPLPHFPTSPLPTPHSPPSPLLTPPLLTPPLLTPPHTSSHIPHLVPVSPHSLPPVSPPLSPSLPLTLLPSPAHTYALILTCHIATSMLVGELGPCVCYRSVGRVPSAECRVPSAKCQVVSGGQRLPQVVKGHGPRRLLREGNAGRQRARPRERVTEPPHRNVPRCTGHGAPDTGHRPVPNTRICTSGS